MIGFRAPLFMGKGCGKGKLFEEEDRSRDWYCLKCQERNFVKRAECFKCRTPKPSLKDLDGTGPSRTPIPQSGTTLDGMVKSYNRKGFGFLMALNMGEHCQDIYYTRSNLSPKLQTRDIPGQHVTFEIYREPNGKLIALNIRPLGDDGKDMKGHASGFGGSSFTKSASSSDRGGDRGSRSDRGSREVGSREGTGGRDDEDRSRDWLCGTCKERNFVKRSECFKCKAPRSGVSERRQAAARAPTPPQRSFSPHAGSRAVRETLLRGGCSRSRSRRGKPRGKKGGNHRKKQSSSSSSSRKRRKEKKNKCKRGSSSSSSPSSSTGCSAAAGKKRRNKSRGSNSRSGSKKRRRSQEAAGAAAAERLHQAPPPDNPELEAAKADALEQLMKLRAIEPREQRMSEFRALLRKWHPDKNPDKVEVATAVFQFLQKGKPMLDPKEPEDGRA